MCLQLFNEINARRPEKLNVFQGIHKNYLFISIIVITVALQVCRRSSFSQCKCLFHCCDYLALLWSPQVTIVPSKVQFLCFCMVGLLWEPFMFVKGEHVLIPLLLCCFPSTDWYLIFSTESSGVCCLLWFVQFVIVEFLNKFAQTTKLPLKWWIFCILIGIVSYVLANPFINFLLFEWSNVYVSPVFQLDCL